jgi:hypothetical protein
LLNNNYVDEEPNSRYSKNRNDDMESKSKADLFQKNRQNSIQNLNKVNNSFPNNTKSYPSYNELWLETSNPNKKI